MSNEGEEQIGHQTVKATQKTDQPEFGRTQFDRGVFWAEGSTTTGDPARTS